MSCFSGDFLITVPIEPLTILAAKGILSIFSLEELELELSLFLFFFFLDFFDWLDLFDIYSKSNS